MYAEFTDTWGQSQTKIDDRRVTIIGRFLRKCSLDEIPQLINVLKGELSLVGPRPHAVEMRVEGKLYHDLFEDYHLRHISPPGITGWAQVNGSRGELRTIQQAKVRLELDFEYLKNTSIRLDVWIMLRTIVVVLRRRLAY
jgi:lipopolysaccharide/colanic/teichoic acid biosynthesis glycosyltransferase